MAEPALILIIEDEAEHRMQVQKVLRFHGYRVVSAESAEDGLEMMRSERPALVMLDLNFAPGGMDGFDLLEVKASDPAIADLRVVVISTRKDERDRVRALRLGATDYLDKPFSPMELAARVRNLVRDRERELALNAANAQLGEANEQLMGANLELGRVATTDALTGVPNRRHFEASWSQQVAQAERHPEHALSVISLDIDKFKSINDNFGHAAGDAVLKRVCQTLVEQVRASDLVGRMGGEEFNVAMAHTEIEGAGSLAEKLRATVEALRIPELEAAEVLAGKEDRVRNCTISVGVASTSTGTRPADLLVVADRALYAAKHGGRNRVETNPGLVEEVAG
ncbi:MAG: GGDEF domain-containing response regulator [Candidatus Dormibacteria bacterium]